MVLLSATFLSDFKVNIPRLKGNIEQIVKCEISVPICLRSVHVEAEKISRDIVNQNFWTNQMNKHVVLARCDGWRWCLCRNQLRIFQSIKILKKLFHSDTLLEGSVKLTSMQLVGEFVAAISVHLDAIKKQENMRYCGKRVVRKCFWIVMKLNNFQTYK